MEQVRRMGLDIGSTTIKIVITEDENVIYSEYRRHHSDIAGELLNAFEEVNKKFPGLEARVQITGSGGLSVAKWLGLDFVQEVIAETVAITKYHPETDVIIELGGEDAKITYLHPVPEQRMNGTCAGGTGAFIDQMATLLRTDADGLNELAKSYTTLYTIASRCGVFAKSDLQPLINEGAAKEDLAASIFQAVVNQTIAGLACGRPIRGHIAFLGGPLFFNSELRKAFERTLEEQVKSFWIPDNAQIYVALGAALGAKGEPVKLSDLISSFSTKEGFEPDIKRIAPLFADAHEKELFDERHQKATLDLYQLSKQKGPCYLGIDAGSTTTKAVLINEEGQMIYTYYASNQGNPVKSAVNIVKQLYEQMPPETYIANSCVTGYGENIIRAALGVDLGEIETMAHFQSAKYFCPDVDFIIDIGGQDMKCMKIRNGVIDSINGEVFSGEVVEVIERGESPLGMIAFAQVLDGSGFAGTLVLTTDVVRHEVDDDAQAGIMGALHERFELLHAFGFVLRQIRIDVVVVGDGVRRTGFTFGNSRVVILRRSVTNDAGIPHMRNTQIHYGFECPLVDIDKSSAAVLLFRAVMLTRLVIVRKPARKELVNDRFTHTSAAVSLAIINSSSVGMRQTVTFEPFLEMIRSSPRTLLASSSSSIPRKLRPFMISARIYGSFSPMPAVKTRISIPFIAAAYAPIYFFTR